MLAAAAVVVGFVGVNVVGGKLENELKEPVGGGGAVVGKDG